jgi:arylsulfatase A-like enzyme
MKSAPAASAASSPTTLPEASVFSGFSAAFASLAILWMPWALLKQIDAFLAFETLPELLRDVALALIILALPALAIALLAAGVGRLAALAGASDGLRRGLYWMLVLLPVAWVCVWQFGSASLAWLRQATGAQLTLSSHGRLAAALVLVAALLMLARRGRWLRLFARVIPTLQGLRGPALLALAASVVMVFSMPPRLLHHDDVPLRKDGAVAGPDVFLITIDTLSAQDAAVCGDGPTLMPRLRAFAGRASCFDRHYASANFTTPSTSTMETGALPWTHWGVQIVAKMAPGVRDENVARLLRGQGYEAHSINANIMGSPRHHGSFAGYSSEAISPSPSLGLKPRLWLTLFPDTTLPFWLSSLIPFLDTLDVYLHGEQSPFAPELTYEAALPKLAAARRPVFMWLHTLPPHDPYLPPPGAKYRLLPPGELDRWSQMRGMGEYASEQQALIDKHRLRYGESIIGADEALGRFLDELERQGRLDQALVIITSDHGESFERGFMGHAGELLHEAVVRVPLVIKMPGQKTGRTVHTPVSLADVAPTIADVTGAPPLAAADGRSLKPALLGETLPAEPVFTMAMERQTRFRPVRAGHYAVIDAQFKLVLDLAADKAELFDLSVDPHERNDISRAAPETAARLRSLLDARLAAAEKRRAAQFDKP